MKEIETYVNKFADNTQSKTILIILIGAFLILFGIVALAHLAVTKIIVMYIFGGLMIAGGFFQLFCSLSIYRGVSKILWIICSGLYIIVGCLIVLQPLITSIVLITFIAFTFLAVGAFKILTALTLRPFNGWQWSLFSGVISILIALLILQTPSEFTWIIGLLVGLDMIFQGSIFLAIGFSIRSIRKSI